MKKETKEFTEKVLKGFHIAFRKEVVKKRKEDGVFAFSSNGKIKRVKAKDIKL